MSSSRNLIVDGRWFIVDWLNEILTLIYYSFNSCCCSFVMQTRWINFKLIEILIGLCNQVKLKLSSVKLIQFAVRFLVDEG